MKENIVFGVSYNFAYGKPINSGTVVVGHVCPTDPTIVQGRARQFIDGTFQELGQMNVRVLATASTEEEAFEQAWRFAESVAEEDGE